ncbi:uncharacterized protein LOC142550869 [Primulina tabacum]|uniref:uncharacterized protein LOC142550869 n=1 Tax=Primulina tabacum TaxID=48773 RepID=UPI003F5A7800
MEIPARVFFWFCWAIGYIFMEIGLDVAERTFSDSVSPGVMHNFNTLIRVSSAILLLYTIVLHPHCGVIAEYSQNNELPPERNVFNFNRSKVKKWVEFAFGMAGTILFQYFFRITSFHQVVTFLYLAVAWLAIIVLVSSSHDVGVFNSLLGNVLVGCTVSEYGLRGTTWIAYGAAVVLYGLKVKLESVALVDRAGKGARVVLW